MKKTFSRQSAQFVQALTQAVLDVAQQHGVNRYDTLVVRDLASAIQRVVDEYAGDLQNAVNPEANRHSNEGQRS